MGGAASGAYAVHHGFEDANDEEMSQLLRSTRYTIEELLQLRAQFFTDVPSGNVTRPTFNTAAGFFGIRAPILCDMIFRAFDVNGDGVVTFFEFARAMSVMTRGTNTDKLLFAFDMLDVDKEGLLRPERVLPLLLGLEASFGRFHPYERSGELWTAKDVVARMLPKSMVTTGMNREAFREFALHNPSIIKGLALAV